MTVDMLREIAHHGVHFIKLLERDLDISMKLLILCILVVEHSSVLVSLLIGADTGVLTADRHRTDTTVPVQSFSNHISDFSWNKTKLAGYYETNISETNMLQTTTVNTHAT